MCISSDFTNIRLKGKDNTPEKMKEYEYVADVAKELPQTGAGESTVYMSAKEGEQKKNARLLSAGIVLLRKFKNTLMSSQYTRRRWLHFDYYIDRAHKFLPPRMENPQ